MSDESWAGLIGGLALLGGGYWLFTHYEIKKRDVAPANASAVAPVVRASRPAGMVKIGADKNGSVWNVDADSVRGPRTQRQGWVFIDASKDKTSSYHDQRILYDVDCGTTAARQLSKATYDDRGRNLTARSDSPEKAKVEYWPPHTFGAEVVTFICDPKFEGRG